MWSTAKPHWYIKHPKSSDFVTLYHETFFFQWGQKMTWCQKHLAKTLNQTVFHLYIFLGCSFIFYLFWVLWVLKCFQRLYFEEKSSYGRFWKINFCHLSFLFPHIFNLFTFHKTCEQAATSVHEKSSQNKRQRLGCCAEKVICPRLQDWVLVLSSVNWAFPPLSCITPTLLSFFTFTILNFFKCFSH